jgi:co-chaperonin GroES (HSP10)
MKDKTESGLLFLPKSGFYDGMANKKILDATIVSCGRDVTTVKEGDKIIFLRIVFARYKELEDKTFVGWVDENEIFAIVED